MTSPPLRVAGGIGLAAVDSSLDAVRRPPSTAMENSEIPWKCPVASPIRTSQLRISWKADALLDHSAQFASSILVKRLLQ